MRNVGAKTRRRMKEEKKFEKCKHHSLFAVSRVIHLESVDGTRSRIVIRVALCNIKLSY